MSLDQTLYDVGMTDDPTNVTQATPVATPADDATAQTNPSVAQDPLAILEGILQDAKNKSSQKKAQSDGATQQGDAGEVLIDGEPPPTEEELAIIQKQIEEEDAARAAELEAQRQQQIAEQQALLAQELPQTPQYQARQQQVAEEEQAKATSGVADGYNIEQLTKTKVPLQE